MTHFFINFINFLLKFCLLLALWVAVFYGLMMAHSYGGEQHYGQNQAIDPKFHVLVQGQKQEIYGVLLRDFQENHAHYSLVKDPTRVNWAGGQNWGELTPISEDVFEFDTDLDTAIFSQRYRITPDNQVEPISFREIANPFSAAFLFLLSLPVLGMVWFLLKKIVFGLRKALKPIFRQPENV